MQKLAGKGQGTISKFNFEKHRSKDIFLR